MALDDDIRNRLRRFVAVALAMLVGSLMSLGYLVAELRIQNGSQSARAQVW